MESDVADLLYSQTLLSLSAKAQGDRRLNKPCFSGQAKAKICGSKVTVDLALDQQGRIVDVGFDVDACTLTMCVLAVMRDAALGCDRTELTRVADQVKALLATPEALEPVLPSGPWAELEILAPARAYQARHEAILLPFMAADRAFAAAESLEMRGQKAI